MCCRTCALNALACHGGALGHQETHKEVRASLLHQPAVPPLRERARPICTCGGQQHTGAHVLVVLLEAGAPRLQQQAGGCAGRWAPASGRQRRAGTRLLVHLGAGATGQQEGRCQDDVDDACTSEQPQSTRFRAHTHRDSTRAAAQCRWPAAAAMASQHRHGAARGYPPQMVLGMP